MKVLEGTYRHDRDGPLPDKARHGSLGFGQEYAAAGQAREMTGPLLGSPMRSTVIGDLAAKIEIVEETELELISLAKRGESVQVDGNRASPKYAGKTSLGIGRPLRLRRL